MAKCPNCGDSNEFIYVGLKITECTNITCKFFNQKVFNELLCKTQPMSSPVDKPLEYKEIDPFLFTDLDDLDLLDP